LAQESRDRRADELLAVAAADDQRAVLARPDQQPGLVGGHGNERVVAAQLRVRPADSQHQVAVVVAGDQVRDHLGIRLGREHGAVVAAVLELLEPGQEQGFCLPWSYVTDDSAHAPLISPVWVRTAAAARVAEASGPENERLMVARPQSYNVS